MQLRADNCHWLGFHQIPTGLSKGKRIRSTTRPRQNLYPDELDDGLRRLVASGVNVTMCPGFDSWPCSVSDGPRGAS